MARFLLFLLLLLSNPVAGLPVADPATVCEQAALVASRQSGVPASVLRAISLTETGRRQGGRFQSWPWTVNMEGEGRWFDTPEAALAYVRQEFARGARSFDVGCFQINYRWHGDAFDTVEEMFDPLGNALYAARFLSELHGEFGSWSAAAGAFHSRTPEYAARYRERFDTIRAGLAAEDGIPDIPDIVLALNGGEPVPRQNLFPLLQGGERGRRGSLFPGSAPSSRPLIGPPSQE
ncbi:tail length tape measure protein [Haematobacter missouriensis]|uniref:lytic transglycosylase domain-containing protein n=1 Tax=Haematobacter missouriensis TaxID=366616 RepID=UPI0004E9117C|nr:lytic transglycosylase domain-containing protein [Haematobacter missouriensis]KFI33792.1 tail length tape measure protein [Haematobacter missouriensis]